MRFVVATDAPALRAVAAIGEVSTADMEDPEPQATPMRRARSKVAEPAELVLDFPQERARQTT